MSDLTRTLARYAVASRFEALPDDVRHEATRAFLNWVGVAIGGCREDAVVIAAGFAAETGGKPQAAVIGHDLQTDVATAAFVNCISSAVFGYDDAHPSSVAHPSGPAAAAVFALAQSRRVTGPEFLNALALGIELQCRVADMLALPPSTFHQSLYINGFSAPVGVAAAVGRLLGLDERRMAWAIGIAATQACGFRAIHGTMSSQFRPGHATRSGVVAALLAARGFDSTEDALEAPGGLLDVFAPGADPARAISDLGVRHEMLSNRLKAYPCGVVIHPTIDALLDIRRRLPPSATFERVRLQVNPLTLTLTGKRAPRTSLESLVSVYHWAAAALLRGACGMDVIQMDFITDPEIAAFRERVEVDARPEFSKGEAKASVTLADGTSFEAHVVNARGSPQRPVSDDDLDRKFAELAARLLSADACERLRTACRQVGRMADVGGEIGRQLP